MKASLFELESQGDCILVLFAPIYTEPTITRRQGNKNAYIDHRNMKILMILITPFFKVLECHA